VIWVEPQSLHHVSVMVDDLAAATDFYVHRLGLQQRTDRPGTLGPGVWLDVGSAQVHLIQGTAPNAAGQHFALGVADLDAAVAELRDAGITVGEPKSIGAGRQAFLSDPSGNGIELQGR
jgi:glyoxylase I family protein